MISGTTTSSHNIKQSTQSRSYNFTFPKNLCEVKLFDNIIDDNIISVRKNKITFNLFSDLEILKSILKI